MLKIKIILDTNIWISFLISNNLKKLDVLINKGKIQFLFSNELLKEFIAIAKRPKFKKYFSNKDIADLLELFDTYGKLINIKSDIKKCKDSKDNFLLNLAIDGIADFLITGNHDLLVMQNIDNTVIISIAEFLKILE